MQKGFDVVNIHGSASAIIAVPTIGENGNWYIGNNDTGVSAQGGGEYRKVLWEGEENTPGNIITLSDGLSNYQYIDIYTYLIGSGEFAISTYDASARYYTCKLTNIINDAASISITFDEIQLDKITDKTLKVSETCIYKWKWTGKYSDNAIKGPTTACFRKIVGRK